MQGYSHLLTGAGHGLECVSCLHIDDIEEKISADIVMKFALVFFHEIGEIPKAVDYQLSSERQHRRLSVSNFNKHMARTGHSVGTTLSSMTITSGGFEGDATSDTWTPRSVVSAALHGRVLEAFLQAPRYTDKENRYLAGLPYEMFGTSFAAAYIFPFPWAFSPLSYGSGISYSPNRKRLGDLTDRDSERVMNWANHCYRGHRASEGYLRDIYAMNIIGQKHIGMRVGNLDLGNWIEQDPIRGSLSELSGKTLWIVESEHLLSVQAALDNAGVLLSAFSPE